MKNDLISVIVPIYGVEKYLEKCVDSIINQNYKNLEIILVDDGSPDKCGEICDKYKEKDKRIIVIHKKNGGLSDARNEGIRKANGKYLVFVDSDDYIDEKLVETLYLTVKKDNTELGICNRFEDFEYKKKNNLVKSFQNNHNHLIMDFNQALIELCSFNLFDMSAWAKIYKRDLFKEIQFPVGKLSEDYYIMYKLFEKAKKISYINEPLYFYNQRKGSISKNGRINYDYKKAAKEQMVYIENKYPKLKKYVRTAYALSNMTIFNWYIKNRGYLPNTKEYNELKHEVKINIKYILENEKLSKMRKLQARIFLTNRIIYGIFFYMYYCIKR